MSSIDAYLSDIFKSFQNYVESNESPKLCDLKSVNYDLTSFPDYNNIHIQEYYLLRYAYAYAFEYKYMYKKLFESVKKMPSIMKILSVGCGNGIDYWSAVEALNALQSSTKIDYTGIDICDWKYIPEKRDKDKLYITNLGIEKYLSEVSQIDFNIIMFPKSISEFSDDSFRRICTLLKTKTFKYKSVVLMFSLRNTAQNLDSDLKRIDDLIHTLKNNKNCNFRPRKYKKEEWINIGAGGIRAYDRDFLYPQDVLSYLNSLHEMCLSYKINGRTCTSECSNRLSRNPILKANDMKYKIVVMTEGE